MKEMIATAQRRVRELRDVRDRAPCTAMSCVCMVLRCTLTVPRFLPLPPPVTQRLGDNCGVPTLDDDALERQCVHCVLCCCCVLCANAIPSQLCE
jgi:hypothetical protein